MFSIRGQSSGVLARVVAQVATSVGHATKLAPGERLVGVEVQLEAHEPELVEIVELEDPELQDVQEFAFKRREPVRDVEPHERVPVRLGEVAERDREQVEVSGVLKSTLPQDDAIRSKKVGKTRITLGVGTPTAQPGVPDPQSSLPVLEVKSYDASGSHCIR